MTTITYVEGSALPDMVVYWTDTDGAYLDFSSGWTFTLKVGQPGTTAVMSKTTGITGYEGSTTTPSVIVEWTTTDLGALDPGEYTIQLRADHTATGKDRTLQAGLRIADEID